MLVNLVSVILWIGWVWVVTLPLIVDPLDIPPDA